MRYFPLFLLLLSIITIASATTAHEHDKSETFLDVITKLFKDDNTTVVTYTQYGIAYDIISNSSTVSGSISLTVIQLGTETVITTCTINDDADLQSCNANFQTDVVLLDMPPVSDLPPVVQDNTYTINYVFMGLLIAFVGIPALCCICKPMCMKISRRRNKPVTVPAPDSYIEL